MAGQIWVTNSLGGYMYSDKLSKVLRFSLQPTVKYRQFCDVKDAAGQGKGKGDTYHWNVYSDVATAGTTLTEASTMPVTNFTIPQGTLSITEYGNSVPYSGKLDDLSQHPVTEIIQKVLKNDAKKAFDTAAFNHFKAISDTMKERNIPPYVNEDYLCIARPRTFRTFKNGLEALHSYVDAGFQMILNGEIGRYEGIRCVEQTNQASAAWTNGKSDKAFFFGADTVAEAIATPEEMRGKIPDDYGRGRGVAWYYLGGFGIVHSAAANARIVVWDSAA